MPVERIDPRNRLSLPALKEALKLYARFNRYAFKYRGSELALILLGNISTIFLLSNPYIGKVFHVFCGQNPIISLNGISGRLGFYI